MIAHRPTIEGGFRVSLDWSDLTVQTKAANIVGRTESDGCQQCVTAFPEETVELCQSVNNEGHECSGECHRKLGAEFTTQQNDIEKLQCQRTREELILWNS